MKNKIVAFLVCVGFIHSILNPLPIFGDVKVNNRIIHTQKEFNQYLSDTGIDLSGDDVTIEPTENLNIAGRKLIVAGNTVWNIFVNTKNISFGTDTNKSNIEINSGKFVWNIKGNATEIDKTWFEHLKIEGNADKIDRGSFLIRMLSSSYVQFNDFDIKNAQIYGQHLFDINASHHIIFSNMIIKGYATIDQSNNAVNDGANASKEAIQLDSGGLYCFSEGYPYTLINFFKGIAEKKIATTDVVLKDSVIEGSDELPRSATAIGSHTQSVVSNTGGFKNITVYRTTFKNTIGRDIVHTDKRLTPVHFVGTISGIQINPSPSNTFVNTAHPQSSMVNSGPTDISKKYPDGTKWYYTAWYK